MYARRYLITRVWFYSTPLLALLPKSIAVVIIKFKFEKWSLSEDYYSRLSRLMDNVLII
jgi:hypothetical protein